MEVTIEKDVYDFLYYTCFGSANDDFTVAINRAFRDLCRTMTGFGKLSNKEEIKENALKLIKSEVNYAINEQNFTHSSFDEWHKKACFALVGVFDQYNFPFSIGQAQKWFNMTFKYLYIIDANMLQNVMPYLHIPVDAYVMDAVSEWDGYSAFSSVWSKLSDYDEYLKFQKWFASFFNVPPFKREFSLWVDTAVRINQ